MGFTESSFLPLLPSKVSETPWLYCVHMPEFSFCFSLFYLLLNYSFLYLFIWCFSLSFSFSLFSFFFSLLFLFIFFNHAERKEIVIRHSTTLQQASTWASHLPCILGGGSIVVDRNTWNGIEHMKSTTPVEVTNCICTDCPKALHNTDIYPLGEMKLTAISKYYCTLTLYNQELYIWGVSQPFTQGKE